MEQKHRAGMSLVWRGPGDAGRNGLRSLRERCLSLSEGRDGAGPSPEQGGEN